MQARPGAIILADFTVKNQFRPEARVTRISTATRSTCCCFADRAGRLPTLRKLWNTCAL